MSRHGPKYFSGMSTVARDSSPDIIYLLRRHILHDRLAEGVILDGQMGSSRVVHVSMHGYIVQRVQHASFKKPSE